MNTAIEFRNLTKSFHGYFAISQISFKIKSGSVHAIIGENGAGKSTAMKILYGLYQPDSGDIYIDGKLWGGKNKHWNSPFEAIQFGIGMVHQHFMLAGPYTVLDNIIIGLERINSTKTFIPTFIKPINRELVKRRLEAISSQFEMKLDWDLNVEKLSVGFQQRVEILKLLYQNAQILIFDEPTAVLTPQETKELFKHLKLLAEQGKTIIIITHKLKEVMDLADRATVFRAGKVAGECEIKNTTAEELASMMLGRKVSLQSADLPASNIRPPVLELNNVSLKSGIGIQSLNFKIHGGEIIGLAGVEGNGQAELLQLLLHPRHFMHQMEGEISILGRDVRNFSAREIKKLGVGIVPDDRIRDALLVDQTIQENFLLGLQRTRLFRKHGMINLSNLQRSTLQAIREYDIRPPLPHAKAGTLSGGNQQKLVLAREFKLSPRFLMVAQPTRGVDIGAIEFIHSKILQARAEGAGVLLISSELDEIFALSDRILVIFRGRIVAEYPRGKVSETELGLKMGGAVKTS